VAGEARTTRGGVGDRTTCRRVIGLGAVTVTAGSCVAEDGEGAFWAIAPLPIAQSMSQLTPPTWIDRVGSKLIWVPDAAMVTEPLLPIP